MDLSAGAQKIDAWHTTSVPVFEGPAVAPDQDLVIGCESVLVDLASEFEGEREETWAKSVFWKVTWSEMGGLRDCCAIV